MAAKLRMMKLLQEIRGFAHLSNRQPPHRSPVLLLAQLRNQARPSRLPRRRLPVQVDAPSGTDTAHPVRIVHVTQASAPGNRLSAS